jgi:NADH:ubiquinone oxidoreductase subunit 4 (subunit M)
MHPGLAGLKLELNAREVATLAPLALLAVCLGVYPEAVLSYLRAPVTALLAAGVSP